MTATPIPRTIALSLYGDLDLSVITEIPKGRLPVKTRLVTEQNRQKAYDWAAKIPGQMFVICPLIDTSETLESVKSAKSEFERIKKDIFPKKKIALLHGRMTGKDKQKILSDFKSKKYDILVATPVVEVGIDIPNATVMIIEGAERFGLAALHQLRGRVGRGALQSFCLLFTSDGGDNPRLRFMEKMNNGLDLAEIDLKFRGPGQRFGTAQHGSWDLKIADFSDLELIRSTRKLAETVFDHPEIFPLLRKVLVESKISATRG